jgi:DNA-binding NtrC family response regulator
LIADDDPDIRNLFSHTLASLGHNITLCESGEEAIEKIQKTLFDILLLDLNMGKASGIDVLKRAKSIDPDIVAMIITANASLETAIQALKLNAYDYVLKPCTPSELTFKVNKCIEFCEQKRKIEAFEKFLHFCAICKKVCINSEQGHSKDSWITLEKYLEEKSKKQAYLGYCPDCVDKVKNHIGNS